MDTFIRERTKRLVENYHEVNRAFKMQPLSLKRLSAFYYAQLDRSLPVDAMKLQEEAMKSKVSPLSSLRGLVLLPMAARLTLAEDPRLLARVEAIYRRLRESFPFSEHLALAALELAESADEQNMDRAIQRIRELHQQLKLEHRLRVGTGEMGLVTRLALTDEPVENMVARTNLCYDALRTEFSGGRPLMGVALYLVLCGDPSEGLLRVVDIAKKFGEYGHKIKGRNYLPVLGILSNAKKDAHTIISETMSHYEELKKAKSFSGWYVQRYELMLLVAALIALADMDSPLIKEQTAYITSVITQIARVTTQSAVV